MRTELINLSLAAEEVADRAREGAKGTLREPSSLHSAMERYDVLAAAYLGLPSVADFIRSEAERYTDRGVVVAFERLAQLTESNAALGWWPMASRSRH